MAGVNGGGFDDPDGLGNGFAPIGFIMSGGNLLFTGLEGSIPQHVVGFTKEGKLIVGKYSINELIDLHVTEAVSFYPRVIADGKPLITSGDGGWGRGPRTAVGQKADGTVIFVVIDGRQAHSVGATLKEVQDLLLEDGVINAGFLDGGASSELVVGDELLTKPSSKYGERRLPSAFLVFDDPSSYKENNPWKGLDHIDPGGAATHEEYQRDLAAQKAANKDKGTPTPAKTASPSPKTSESVKPRETDESKPTATRTPAKTDPPASTKPEPTATPAPETVPPKPTPKPSAPAATATPGTTPPASTAPTAASPASSGPGATAAPAGSSPIGGKTN
ncbi:phosphodiester glycosidase family protein [Paenibacillus sp. CC-CFT747]|nr:phosphodiester glycosidase family protein [Paenibacillus sp. CC-CFT747]